jgi:hypothetical protein
MPLCPLCHRPVSWEALVCPYCGHLFDPEDAHQRDERFPFRRDASAHRGKLIETLGTITLFGGALTFCTGGIGMVLALCTGVAALLMARHDLAQMKTGIVDPQGKSLTEYGQNKAIIGLVLALLFGLFLFLAIVNRVR